MAAAWSLTHTCSQLYLHSSICLPVNDNEFQSCYSSSVTQLIGCDSHFFFLKVDTWPPSSRKHLYSSAFLWLWGLCSSFLFCFFHSSSLALRVKCTPMVTHFMGKYTNVLLLKRKRCCFVNVFLYTRLSYPLTCPPIYSFLLMVASVVPLMGCLVPWRWLAEWTNMLHMFHL